MVDSLVDELRPIEAGPGSKPLAALGGDLPAPPKQARAELGRCWPSNGSGCRLRWWRR